MSKKSFAIFTVLILLIGLIPRAVEVIGGNYLFGFDQGLFFQEVKKIIVDKKLTLIGAEVGGAGGFFQGPGWYYLLSIPFIIASGDPYGGMVMMLVFGVATIFFAIFLGKKIFEGKTALLIGFLIAISPGIISQSRFIWPPFITTFISVFLIFFIFKILERKGKFLSLAALAIGSMFHFEIATGAIFFLQFLIFLPILFYKKFISFKNIIFSLLVFGFTQLPLIVFDLRHDFLNIRGVLRLFSSSNEFSNTFLFLVKNHLDVFRINFLSSFQASHVIWFVIIFILVVGSYLYLRDKANSKAKKILVLYLLTNPLLIFIVFLLYSSTMWQWWILPLSVFYCFVLGTIIAYFWQKNIVFLKFISFFVIVLFFVWFSKEAIGFYKYDLNDYGGVHKIKGKTDAIDFIYNDASGGPFGLLIFAPPIYTYAYDYLLWWQAEKKYNYKPHREKKGEFYLLIEPDPHKPWTYKGWLETVIKTGKIVKTVELPSGFIIEKRIEDQI